MHFDMRRYSVFTWLTLGCLLVAAPTFANQYTYTYFDEPQTLSLDRSRVALLASDEIAPRDVAAQLTPLGIDASQLEPVAIPQWTIAGLTAAKRDHIQLESLVANLSAHDAAAFVSPVFYGPRGYLMLVTPDLLVGFTPETTSATAEDTIARNIPGTIIDRNFANLPGVYRIRTDLRDGFTVLALANRLASMPEVVFAEPDMIVRAELFFIPNDPLFSQQWALNQSNDQDMDAPEAWDLQTGNSNIIVSIMDAGIQQNHPDINQIPGQDFTGSGTTGGGPANQCDNHGTCVAGCVAATIDNGVGITGVAPDCIVTSAKIGTTIEFLGICTPFVDMQDSYLVNALNWSQSIGARVTNSSFGLEASSTVTTAYNQTRAAGVLHMAATGNDGSSSISYPASLTSVCAVGALNSSGARADFSQYGTGIMFSAPGEQILTTDRTGSSGYESGDYATVDGTSFSSPYAAGVAALVCAQNPALSADEVEQILQDTSVDLGATGYDTTYGYGFLNAYNAVVAAAPPATGACCYADGSCAVTEQAACTGAWLGADTDCSPNPCPQPTGACCAPDGTCTVTEEANCTFTWLGADTTCDPNPCAQPWCLGDMNCSGGSPDFADILYFSAAVGDQAGWEQYYRNNHGGEDPPCPWLLGDYNGGGVEFSDITPFANSVGQPCIVFNP